MSRIVSKLVLVLWILMVDISYSQRTTQSLENLTCDKLPKVKLPDNKVLVANSPFEYDYTANSWFDCARNINVNPARGSTDHDGSAVVVKGPSVTVHQYKFGDNGLSAGTECNSGEKSVWYSPASYFDANGGFLCLYSCNGTALRLFLCFSNNNGTSPQELKAVEKAKRVPNGHEIRPAMKNCSPSKGCKAFY